MLIEGLVMAGAVALAGLVVMPGHLPDPHRGSGRRVGAILGAWVTVLILAVIGGFGFALLANA